MSIYSDLIIADEPISYWRLGEPSGTTADDAMNLNDGVYVNVPTFAQTGAIQNDADTAVLFNGTNEYVSLPSFSSIPFGTAPCTLEAWIKPTTHAASRGIIGYGSRASNDAANYIRLGSSTALAWVWQNNDFSVTVANLSGRWHHVVGTWDLITRKLYLDGFQIGGDNTPARVPNWALGNGFIGAFVNTTDTIVEFFDGAIDEVAIYDYALTAEQILEHYRIGGSVKIPMELVWDMAQAQRHRIPLL